MHHPRVDHPTRPFPIHYLDKEMLVSCLLLSCWFVLAICWGSKGNSCLHFQVPCLCVFIMILLLSGLPPFPLPLSFPRYFSFLPRLTLQSECCCYILSIQYAHLSNQLFTARLGENKTCLSRTPTFTSSPSLITVFRLLSSLKSCLIASPAPRKTLRLPRAVSPTVNKTTDCNGLQ